MPHFGRSLRSALAFFALACGAAEAAHAQGNQNLGYDVCEQWEPRTTGWQLPLCTSDPPYHHLVFAQPASLEIWGRPRRFAYYAGIKVDRPRGQRFAFGEAREDVVWIGDKRSALARQVLAAHADLWSEESTPRKPEKPWGAPLGEGAALEEAALRLGRAAWGARLRDFGRESTHEEWARTRGEHELLFALGGLLLDDASHAEKRLSAEERTLAGLLVALGHSNYPHELLRGEIEDAARLAPPRIGEPAARDALLSALLDALSAMSAEETPELDRERQALAQLDRAEPQTLRLAARAAAAPLFGAEINPEREAKPFSNRFKLEQKNSAGGGHTTKIAGPGVDLRFEEGRPRLERGLLRPWGEDVAVEKLSDGRSAFRLRGRGVLQIVFDGPDTVSSASLSLRHRIEGVAAKAPCGILITIEFDPVVDPKQAVPRGERSGEQSFDLTGKVRAKASHNLLISLAPDAPPEAIYWLEALELSIEE